jgi:polysaccharide export outer membrane protein
MIFAAGVLRDVATAQETAPPKELMQYVRDARKAGLNDKQIQQNAEGAGWPSVAVAGALTAAAPAGAATTEKNPGKDPVATKTAAEDNPTAPVKPEAASEPAPTPGTPNSNPAKNPASAGGVPSVAGPAGSGGTGGVPLSGVADPSVKPAQTVNRGVPDDFKIGAGDVLHVNVWGEPTASVNGAVVRTDGKISLPLVHDIFVMGMTPAQAEKVIAEQLGRFLTSPDVAVIVGGIASKKIYVTGQVKKEGTIPFTYRMTVMQAISEAGGLTPYAKRKKIYVLRNEDGQSYRIPFDYDAVLRGEHMEMNVPLIPGDQLIVP